MWMRKLLAEISDDPHPWSPAKRPLPPSPRPGGTTTLARTRQRHSLNRQLDRTFIRDNPPLSDIDKDMINFATRDPFVPLAYPE